ncbi:hypothetical protein FZEAL_10829 [Fusarium zealandicum]|uniref:DUF7492 domain-containing protein n=1 Tax=Fusarium zealandicum TaxID=1053134 RepID=A0A8H4TVJ9_9HYPO|nr:hypothetical protein FZEAL_10829 [Fusarium zealandicum]
MKIAAPILALAGTTLISSTSAHSWVEYAFKLARNGTMIGNIGFPRGYVPRDSTNPPFTDTIPQNILPAAGQPAYSGDEVLNKFKMEKKPKYPMLEAAPGDYVAIMHLENGHTTLPENQPNKPKNRGTIYFYGTSKAKDEEKLFDVHLLWNKDGTGGDKRGRLIATRNYDDGQCYQPNPGELSTARSSELAHQGALPTKELACQSDIKLPDDLKAGDIYTIYWYWDWPDLNSENIDMDATKNGKFPWAGTFMRGDKDPSGFSVDAIARNESYSSVIDIKIAGAKGESFAAKDMGALDWVEDQNIYSAGIEAQMKTNFLVDVDGGQGGGSDVPSSAIVKPTSTKPSSTKPTDGGAGNGEPVATVTVTQTVQPPATVTTVYVTVPAESMNGPEPAPTEGHDSTESSTTTVMVTKTRKGSVPSDSVATPPASTVVKTLFTTRSKPKPTSTLQDSTVVETLTTHISSKPSATGEELSSQPVRTVIETLTTHINTPSSTTAAGAPQNTVPGGHFRETPLPGNSDAPTQTRSNGPPIPSGFLRRRENWVFGDF